MQQQRFQDCFSTTFSTYPSMLNYHEMQSQTSLWTRCPVKELYVEPLDLASLLAAEDGFAPGISKEALYDTMENLGLAIRVNGAYYPVRETAYRSLLGRAKIGGTALPKLEKQKLADVLNNCLRLFKQDALVLVRDEKVSAVHSGDDADYSVLPIDELLNVLQTKLDERFPGNVFKEGYENLKFIREYVMQQKNEFVLSFWQYLDFSQLQAGELERCTGEWRELYMNLAYSFWYDPEQCGEEKLLKLLDDCLQNDMRLIIVHKNLHWNSLKENGADQYEQDVKQAVKKFGKHPACFGFMVGDEPDKNNWELAQQATKIVQANTDKVAFLNFNPPWFGEEFVKKMGKNMRKS